MKILVTGAAGFIGFHICQKLAESGHTIVGIDNLNNYYDVDLKWDRLKVLGFQRSSVTQTEIITSEHYSALSFQKIDICDDDAMTKLFDSHHFDVVCHLAAQAGVRYSITHPRSYIESNIRGFFNVLEGCRHSGVPHLVYASSSSVYGDNSSIPFSTEDKVDSPVSLYAATKKSNELMAHSYCHLYGFRTTGLRFFTVYGPWGRPDMAYYLFTNAIQAGEEISLFNDGDMERDFTYVDDITKGIQLIVESQRDRKSQYQIYNIGNNQTRKLADLVELIEQELKTSARKRKMPMQPGDVHRTYANIAPIQADYGFEPSTSLEEGIKQFVSWFKEYHISP